MPQELTPEIVKSVYLALLGRPPENDEIIERACRAGHQLEHFIKRMLDSEEFLVKWRPDQRQTVPKVASPDLHHEAAGPAVPAEKDKPAIDKNEQLSLDQHLLGRAQLERHLGMPGFELPDLPKFEQIPASLETKAQLAQRGIRIEGKFGTDSFVLLEPNTIDLQLTIHFFGKPRALIILEGGCYLRNNSVIYIVGGDSTVVVRTSNGPCRLTVQMRGDGGLFFFGKNATTNITDCLVQGPAAVLVGEDSMFAAGTVLRSFDSHALIDASSGSQINKPEDVRIGRHVWLGFNALVLPGVDIGDGAIVGAGSIVTRSIPPRTLSVGVPARQIRQNVSWAREEFPRADQIRRALEWSGPSS